LRLFVALELPAAAVHALVAWQEAVVAGRPGLRPVGSESLHVTLCFLGERPEAELDALRGACEVVGGASGAPLGLGEAWWLPRRRPRVLACAIADDDGVLREAQGLLIATLRRAVGFEPERRGFFPHVTVARVRGGARVRPAPLTGPDGVAFLGSRVTLFESTLGEGPARYQPLHSVSL
jgi:RNA 2',3'-cyclic 3'-phosphodiesterase